MVNPSPDDREAQMQQPLLSQHYPKEKSGSCMEQPDVELRIGNDNSMRARSIKLMTQGLKAISVLIVAVLAVHGFWALARPDLYARYAESSSLTQDSANSWHHYPDFPGEPDYEHRRPPHHRGRDRGGPPGRGPPPPPGGPWGPPPPGPRRPWGPPPSAPGHPCGPPPPPPPPGCPCGPPPPPPGKGPKKPKDKDPRHKPKEPEKGGDEDSPSSDIKDEHAGVPAVE